MRLDELDSNSFESTLDRITTDIEDIKNRQIISKNNLTPRILSSDREYDAVAEFFSPTYTTSTYIKFTADHQLNPFMLPYALVYELNGAPFQTTAIQSYFVGELFSNYAPHKDDGIAEFQVFVNSTARAFKVKIFVQVSDTGSLFIGGFDEIV